MSQSKLAKRVGVLAAAVAGVGLWAGTAVEAALITGVTATASSNYDSYPLSRTVDGSGLYGTSTPFKDHYAITANQQFDSWLSNGTQTATLTYNLGQVYGLDEIHLWNYNDARSGNAGTGAFGDYKNFGRGIRQADIWLSNDGTNYTLWQADVIFPDAPASSTYTGFDLETVASKTFTTEQARYIQIRTDNNWANGTNSGYTGLAEVQFFGAIPEPATIASVLGLGSLALLRRRRR
jgi:hypothetical protein